MSKQKTISVLEQDLQALEMRIEELIHVCGHLKQENQTLHEREHALSKELTAQRQKNSVACSRVEAMLEKMNLLESNPPGSDT